MFLFEKEAIERDNGSFFFSEKKIINLNIKELKKSSNDGEYLFKKKKPALLPYNEKVEQIMYFLPILKQLRTKLLEDEYQESGKIRLQSIMEYERQ